MPRRVTSLEHKRALGRKAALKWRNANLEVARAASRAWRADKEKAQAYDRAWYKANAERLRARRRELRQANLVAKRAYERAWQQKNRDKVRAAVRKWQVENPDKARASDRKWASNNRDKTREKSRIYQTRLRAVGVLHGHHTPAEWQACLARHGHRCAHCPAATRLTRDHIVPLSKGGTDLIENIQPLCGPCNSRKGARLAA